MSARLSKKFFDTFGEELVREMVDWFNQIDNAYRGDLKELNDLNFARFEAKLEVGLAAQRAEFLNGCSCSVVGTGGTMTTVLGQLLG